MSEKKALSTVQLTVSDWEMAKEFGLYAEKSGIGREHKNALKVYAAKELGLSSIAALKGIHIIDGTPSLSPKLVWANIVIHPEFENYEERKLLDSESNFLGYEIALSRTNGINASRQFTLNDAKQISVSSTMNLIDKDNWKNYPERMCYWRAMAFVQDVVFPDVSLGLIRSDELGADITPDGEVVKNDTWQVEPTLYEQEQQAIKQDLADVMNTETIPDYGYNLTQLLETAQEQEIDIASFNNGNIPQTDEQVNQLVHKLVQKGLIDYDFINF